MEDEVFKIDRQGLEGFLAGPMVVGIGRVYASRIVEFFGDATLDILLREPERIGDVPGIGSQRGAEAAESLQRLQLPIRFLVFLYSAGLTDSHIERIVAHYGQMTPPIVAEDPYQMVEDVWKLSFYTADKIGRYMDIAADDPRRLRGALLTAVKHYAEDGHLFATRSQAVEAAAAIAGVDEASVEAQVEPLAEEHRIVMSRGALYLPPYYTAEKEGAERIATICRQPREPLATELVPETGYAGHVVYSEAQRQAIAKILSSRVSVLTGGPGTGKTTALRGLIDMLREGGEKVVLAAPTGRAAKRMSMLTGSDAMTLHRLLGHRPGEGYSQRKIDADTLIIDEGSMLEQVMFNHLLSAMRPTTRLVIVGDPDQLPAIGAGDVLRDLIDSGVVPVVRLEENFRQAQGGAIAENARVINAGLLPQGDNLADFTVVYEPTNRDIHRRVLRLVTDEIPSRRGVDPKDILVVTPQLEGPLGARALNVELQQLLNPVGPELRRGAMVFRLGDKVMQTSNSYERGIFNGETGLVTAVDTDLQTLTVTFVDGRQSAYGVKELGELSLAYATTVHKLQGSEADYMVMPVALAHRSMLYRNLLYTGVSRARCMCVLVGEREAIEIAVRNANRGKRNSHFGERLKSNLQ